ncbi:MAG: dihydrofolate reductase [Candidatus Saccharimonadales bacterium]|jgi:dihydrofolate reductase
MIALIAAKADSDIIGSRGDLPWYLPADLQHFRQLTSGETVVMGRKTLDSIIERLGHPLPDRRNVVVTRQESLPYDGVEIIHDISLIRSLGERVFVIGGAEIYQQTIGMADTLHVTEVHATIDGDATFPLIDPASWRETSRETHRKDDKNQYDYDFVTYERQ